MTSTNTSKLPIAIGIIVLAVAITTFGIYYANAGSRESTNDAHVNADFTLIAPQISGFIEEVLIADNQAVKAGQLLAQIDDKDYVTELLAAQAKVAAAKAKLHSLSALLKQQGSTINQVKAGIDGDAAELGFARHEFERYKNLAAKGAGTLQNSQQAGTRLTKATAQLHTRQAALESATTEIEVLTASREAAIAEFDHAKAYVRKAELNLSYTRLTAPFDGVVGKRSVRKGAYVKPGDLLMAVVPNEKFYVTANYREVQLTHVRPGQAAEIEIDTFPGQKLHGVVDSLAPATGVTFAAIAPDNATGNFTKVVQRIPVKIALEPGQALSARLKVGMSVEAHIDTQAEQGDNR